MLSHGNLGLLVVIAPCTVACVATDLSPVDNACAGGTPCSPENATQCLDGETKEMRAPVSPAEGDLVISEVMAAPATVSGTNGEWFELYARKDVDLNGLVVRAGNSKAVLSSPSCLRARASAYVLLGRNGDSATNGGLPALTVESSVTLPDSASSLSVASGSKVIDQIAWTTTKKGVAWQVSPSLLDGPPSERARGLCLAVASYGAGDRGTPGLPNTECPTSSVALGAGSVDGGSIDDTNAPDRGTPAGAPVDGGSRPMMADTSTGSVDGQCLDPSSGLRRSPLEPKAGDLVITEIMAAPSVGNNGPGEWFEVLATASVDLNGLELANEGSGHTLVASTTCLRVSAGDWLLFARSSDPTVNGSLPAVAATFSFALVDASSSTVPERAVALRFGGKEIARATWTKSTKGVSRQLSATKTDVSFRLDSDVWCSSPADSTSGSGDRGTPGSPNLACANP